MRNVYGAVVCRCYNTLSKFTDTDELKYFHEVIQHFFFCADGLMDVQEECAKFGVVRGFKFDGDSTAGYKVILISNLF